MWEIVHKEIDTSVSEGKKNNLDVDEEVLLNGGRGAWGKLLQNADGPFPFYRGGLTAASMASLL
jgi:hypothetical protein